MALLVVITQVREPAFALNPVALDSVLLVLAGVILNPLGGRRYPHPQGAAPPAVAPKRVLAFADADLQAVLARYIQIVDLPRDDLLAFLAAAEQEALKRRLGTLRCRDVMTPQPLTGGLGVGLGVLPFAPVAVFANNSCGFWA